MTAKSSTGNGSSGGAAASTDGDVKMTVAAGSGSGSGSGSGGDSKQFAVNSKCVTFADVGCGFGGLLGTCDSHTHTIS